MFKLLLTLCIILAISEQSLAGIPEEKIQNYRDKVASFKERTKNLVQHAQGKRERDINYINYRMNKALDEGLQRTPRNKRDTDAKDIKDDAVEKLTSIFTSIKDAFTNIGDSDIYKSGAEKVKEISDTVTGFGKKIGDQIQQAVKKDSK